MIHWMCANCGHLLQWSEEPDKCPTCGRLDTFYDVTLYMPDGSGGNAVDALLIGQTLGKVERPRVQEGEKPISYVPENVALGDLLDGLTQQQKDAVRNLGRHETFEKNSVICTEGAEATKLYLVEIGQVMVQSAVWSDVRVPITIVSSGEAFAWSALVPPYRLTATVVASSRTKVLTIEREALLGAMRADADLALQLMQNIARITASRLRNLQLALAGAITS